MIKGNHSDAVLRWRKKDGSRLVWTLDGELRLCDGPSGLYRVIAESVSKDAAKRWATLGRWEPVGDTEVKWIIKGPKEPKPKKPPSNRYLATRYQMTQKHKDEVEQRVQKHAERIQSKMEKS